MDTSVVARSRDGPDRVRQYGERQAHYAATVGTRWASDHLAVLADVGPDD